jgi:hypothetical protein
MRILFGAGGKHCHFSGNFTATCIDNGNFPFLSTPHRLYGGRLIKNENNKVLHGSVFCRKVAVF